MEELEEDRDIRTSRSEGYGSEEVERELVRCLSGDAKAVARVCTDIVSWTGPVQHPAWENPNRNVSILNYLEQSSESTLQYIPALEQTLDIIHIYLKLIVSYLNQMPLVIEAFKSSEMALATKRVTLPALVWMLWSRIRFLNDELYKTSSFHIEQSVNTTKHNKISQTDETCFTCCENCQLTKELVSRLVDSMEKICKNLRIPSSHIQELRKKMATDIFFLTQWGALAKWCEALSNDIEQLGNLAWQMSYQNKKFQSKFKQIKQDVMEYEERLKSIEAEKTILKSDADKANEAKSSCLKKVNELQFKLKTKTSQCETLEKKYLLLDSTVVSLKKEVAESKQNSIKEKEKFIELTNELKSKTTQLEQIQEELKLKNSNEVTANFDFNNKLATQECTISALQTKMDTVQKELHDALKREETLKDDLVKEQHHGEVIWRNYETLKEANLEKEKLLIEKNLREEALLKEIEDMSNHLGQYLRHDVELTGDPVQDMENQKKENEALIRKLSEHNQQISRTLSRLYSHSTPSMPTT